MPVTLEERAGALRQAAELGRSSDVMELLRGLGEADRQSLRRLAIGDLRALIKARTEALNPKPKAQENMAAAEIKRLYDDLRGKSAQWVAERNAARLAVIGVGTRREAETALFARDPMWGRWDFGRPPEGIRLPLTGREVPDRFWCHAGLALADRPEAWAREVLLALLEYQDPSPWTFVSTGARLALGLHLIDAGVLDCRAAGPALGRLARQSALSGINWEDPLSLEVMWAALEGRDDPSMASLGQPVQKPILEAVAAGRMPRDRMVELALCRLSEMSRPFEVSWWGHLLDELKLQDSEWEIHRDAALDLVAAPTARASAVGVAAAKKLLARKAVEPAELLPPVSAAVGCEAVGVAKGAVALLRAIAKADETLRPEALGAALGGLSHPKPAVHEAILAWLEADSWWRDDADLVATLAELTPAVAPAAGARLSRLLGVLSPADGVAVSGTPAASAPSALKDQSGALAALRASLTEHLERESDPGRHGWLAACLDALDGKGDAPEPWEPSAEVWRDDPPFVLPQSAEETAALLLQGTLFGAALDKVLAGVRRPIPPGEREEMRRLVDPVLSSPVVGELARRWVGAPPPVPGGGTSMPAAWVTRFAWTRRTAIAIEAMARGDQETPLCTPTQETGWLDPEVLAERICRRKRIEGGDLFELSSALYRLAPGSDTRARAWKRLAPVIGRLSQRVRLALAGALSPGNEGDRAIPALALLAYVPPSVDCARLAAAAAYCRYGLGHTPGVSRVLARFTLNPLEVLPEQAVEGRHWLGFNLLQLAFDLPGSLPRLVEKGLTRRDQRDWWDWLQFPWEQSLVFLRRRDIALRPVLGRILNAARESEAGVRAAAAETLVVGLRDGRLRSCDLREAFGMALTNREAKPRVLLGMLERIAGEGEPFRELAACCVERAVAEGLAGLTGADRAALLEALLGWRSAAGRSVEDPTASAALRVWAEERKSNRTAELARQLIQLPPAAEGVPSSRAACTQHDVALALRLSPAFAHIGQ